MKKSNFSIITTCAIIIAVLCFISCNFEDDEPSKDNSSLQLSALKGTWTTVAVESVPSTQTIDKLMGYSFEIYWDDGYYFDNNKHEAGYIILDGSEILWDNPKSTLIKILSYDTSIIKVLHPGLDGAVFVMKKFGSLTNEDYINKLCYGLWIHGFDNVDPFLMSYEILYDGKNIQQTAYSYGDRFQLVEFKRNGTGICCRGNSGYSFTWTLTDKRLFIKTSTGKEKNTKLSFYGIEGGVYLKFQSTFDWYE